MARQRRSPGEGSFYKRKDGRWVVAMPNPDRGDKPIVSYHKDEAGAKAEYKRLCKLRDAGVRLGSDRQTLEEWMTQWLEVNVRPHVRDTTYAGYEWTIRRYILPDLGTHTLASLNRQELQRFINRKAERYAPGTLTLIRARLSSALEEAYNSEILQRNPAHGLRLPHNAQKKAVTLTLEQAQKYLTAIKGKRLEALFAVALSLGLRRGEMLGLHWQDIDFETRVVHIRHNLQVLAGKLVIGPPKNRSSEADVYLPQGLSTKLFEHLHRQMQERELAGDGWVNPDLVFTNASGGPIWPNSLNVQHHSLLKKAGLPPMTLHDLRKSCATLLHAQGISDKEIQAILRHSSPLVTSQIYIQAVPTLQREALDNLDDLLFGQN